MAPVSPVSSVLAGLDVVRGWQEEFYRDLHRHPELSHKERRTAAKISERLGPAGFQVHQEVGATGVVGVLARGSGPTVLLRADTDALPVAEATGLTYASSAMAADEDGTEVPVAHACGHDVHVSCLLGAAALLAGASEGWNGTVVALFQPAEETGDGAPGMLAVLQLNIRTYSEQTRSTVLDAVRRIVTAECQASDSPKAPEFELFDRFPLTDNDPTVTARVAAAFDEFFGDHAGPLGQQTASEDFSDIPNTLGVPYTYWGIGGIDPAVYRTAAEAGRVAQDIPVNHSPNFAPVIQPTLDTGTQALVVAALAWLAPSALP
jgi:metal-dependent amidase/aminoacylase/carboxypeptidase family protein